MDQASFSVQTAGVYQFSRRALILGVSRGTSSATVTRTVLTTAMKKAAPVSSKTLPLVIRLHLWCLVLLLYVMQQTVL